MHLKTPKFDVILDNGDGTYLEAVVQTDNRDSVRWDLTRVNRKWPQVNDAPFLWGTFMVWSALSRAGDITESFDEFEPRCLQASGRDKDAADVDPTQSGSRIRLLTLIAAQYPSFPLPWLMEQNDTQIETILDIIEELAEGNQQ